MKNRHKKTAQKHKFKTTFPIPNELSASREENNKKYHHHHGNAKTSDHCYTTPKRHKNFKILNFPH